MKKMLTACVVFTLGLSMAAGQNAASYVGVWSVRIDTQTFAVVALTMSEGGLVGNVTLPEQFETNGLTISHISGSAHENLVEKAVVEGSSLHLTTHSLSDPTDQDEWLIA